MIKKNKSQAPICSSTFFYDPQLGPNCKRHDYSGDVGATGVTGPSGTFGSFGPNDGGYINGYVRAAAKHITAAIDLYCFGHYGASNQQIPDDHGLVVALNALKLVDIDTAPFANTDHDSSLFDIPVVKEREVDPKMEEMLKQIVRNIREEEK